MALEAHTDLNETPAGKHDANCPYDAEDDVRHIVDSSFSFTCCQNGEHANSNYGAGDGSNEITLQDCLASAFLKSSNFMLKIILNHFLDSPF